ncbi:NADP-dependent phosphogluconate dehydrogenase [Reichenbachiella agarivorans]|uniref:6-phosphogluconate dehydrogenase, decarboxylating n=1 Tax=Reichenbachiella agarivorans TaxID=2979464 RepID=A0ABY6CM33_9BACT|nr:NADP-dependent phosphogluconate dehydrogenase [Reichenbachiella agarivorans]UXP31571.1 NADP-dependent phosphogluconate dehydrogenase [Reichenbachiella agarivorans]
MSSEKYVLGMVGLGVMGRSLLLNMADHGFKVSGLDKDPNKVDALEKEANGNAKGYSSAKEFIDNLQKPRAVMMLVPAGPAVDAVIAEIAPLLDEGDLLIDGGNSYYTDTDRRFLELKAKGLHFFGMGVSGGEEGARKGPSMMPGGDPKAYEVVRPIFEAIAAKVNGDPCVTYIGPGSAGNFVKMVHNGIEYGIMQLIAETYEIMQKGLGLSGEQMYQVFKEWNEGRLKSFLIEITRDIFAFKDADSGTLLLDLIKDEARSKGTGKWTSQIAMDLQLPIPTIDSSVEMRDLSKYKDIRTQAAAIYRAGDMKLDTDQAQFIKSLEEALFFSMMVTYSQGMHMLAQASKEHSYELQMDQIALIWRGGCIIRSEFLEDIYQAYKKNKTLPHLLLDSGIKQKVDGTIAGMRLVVSSCIAKGIAIPAYATTLSYFDVLRSERMPSNLIQAQRDYFGAHTYERIDAEGLFHSQWNPNA